jgi:hypothetical protein
MGWDFNYYNVTREETLDPCGTTTCNGRLCNISDEDRLYCFQQVIRHCKWSSYDHIVAVSDGGRDGNIYVYEMIGEKITEGFPWEFYAMDIDYISVN